jgi:hypothetical protein
VSALRRALHDFRSPPKWTLADKKRPCEVAFISAAWPRNPFGLLDVRVLPDVTPAVFRRDGLPVATENPFSATWGELVERHPDWSLIDGRPCTITWGAPGQSLTPVDMTRLDVIEAWVELVLEHLPWASGLALDYWSTLVEAFWASPGYWRAWNVGLAHATMLLREARPDWHLSSREWHLTPVTPYVDSLFLEEHPQHFGMTIAQHEAKTFTHPGAKDFVIEVRKPEWIKAQSGGAAYLEQILALVERQGCLLSWKRDELAGVGFPG